jgi:hypothetical protein
MLGVIAKSLDRGVQIVVLLAGTRVALWRQTFERTIEHLDQWTPETDGEKKLQRIFSPEPIFLNTEIEMPGLDLLYHVHPNRLARSLQKGRPLIAVVMKQGDHLARFGAHLRASLDRAFEDSCGPVHVLVVDDEADDGSILDARQEAELAPDSVAFKSLPRHIARIWAGTGPLHKTYHPHLFATYLAYTATPQSNVLQSEHNPLHPTHFVAALRTALDRGNVVPPRSSTYAEPLGLKHYYTGGELYYRRVEVGPNGLCVPHTEPMAQDYDDISEFQTAWRQQRSEMIGDALRCYFVAAAATMLMSDRRLSLAKEASPASRETMQGLTPSPSSMLVHPTASIDGQLQAAKVIAAWTAGFEGQNPGAGDYLLDETGRPTVDTAGLVDRLVAEEELWLTWLDAFEETSNSLLRKFGDSGTATVSVGMWPEVKNLLVSEIFANVKIRVVNSDPSSDDRPIFSLTPIGEAFGPPPDTLSIYVSGNVMARGITIEGLTTTLFLRDANEPAADTQMQMQRWFGYRGKYLPYCRVFLYESQVDLFRAYHENDEAMRQEILAAMNSTTSESVGPLVLQGAGFRATGKIANLGALPLCPGPQPFVSIVETKRPDGNCGVLSDLLDGHESEELLVGGRRRGKIFMKQFSMVETAGILESFRFTEHNPDQTKPAYSRWAKIEAELGIGAPEAPLFRSPAPGDAHVETAGPKTCPFSIAAYLRLWSVALKSEARGLYPTDDYRTPWSMINLSAYASAAPRFWIGVRYGDAGAAEGPRLARHGIRCMARQVDDGRMISTWGSRNPGDGEGAYLGDHLFDYHHTGLVPPSVVPGEATWRLKGHPGLLLFHVIKLRDSETVAVGLGVPLGGPDHFAAFVHGAVN